MAERSEIRMGEHKVAREGVLTGTGIGSCLLICLYDPKTRIGGMAHAMLPAHGAQKESGKFADSAVTIMLLEMEKLGADRKSIGAKLVGGARMFQSQDRDSTLEIGLKNAMSAKEKLGQEKVPILGEDTGGSHGRSVEFDLSSGVITVRMLM